jgi:hypothetical protein
MTFKDVFKSSFLEKAVEFSILDVLRLQCFYGLCYRAIHILSFTKKPLRGLCTQHHLVFPLWL